MTVAEIKEFIDEQLNDENKISILGYRKAFREIKSMLDELEPKAKWTNNMNGTFTCSKCGAKRPNDNYCGNCGARMNDELEEYK